MGPGPRRHPRDERGRRLVPADGMERNRAGCPCGGAGRVVERRDLFRQLGLDRGTAQAANKELRGATMGLHSMCGYAGGFIGPLGAGLVLD